MARAGGAEAAAALPELLAPAPGWTPAADRDTLAALRPATTFYPFSTRATASRSSRSRAGRAAATSCRRSIPPRSSRPPHAGLAAAPQRRAPRPVPRGQSGAPGAWGRTKSAIGDVMRVYLDIDEDGDRALARILADAKAGELPPPTHVVRSSPGRFQVLWSVPRGALDHGRAEALTKGLAIRYGADTQVIDVARSCGSRATTTGNGAARPARWWPPRGGSRR